MLSAGRPSCWPRKQHVHPLLLLVVLASACCSHAAAQVLGDVFMYEDGRGEREPVHFDPFPDLPADFGPEVPDEGIDGLLLVADPEDACQRFKYRYDDEPWVALISRSQHMHPTNCTFDVKVRHAQAAGASAAIVYDDVYEALIIMSKPMGPDHPNPGIPAVFVSEKAGIIMRKLMTPGVTRVRIVPVSASAWMSLLMSAFLGFLALTVVLATFFVMRSWSLWLGRTRRRGMPPDLAGFGGGAQAPSQEGLPACVINALPILVYVGKQRRHSATTKARQAEASRPVARTASAPAGGAPGAGGPGAWLPAQPTQQQQQHQEWGDAGDGAAAVLLIESDDEGMGSHPSTAARLLTRRELQQREQVQAAWRQQHDDVLGDELDGDDDLGRDSGAPSGLVSLASLAAAGTRLLLFRQSPPAARAASSPPLRSSLAAAAAAGLCDSPDSSGHSASTAAAPAADRDGACRRCPSPVPSDACSSPLLSTDDEDWGDDRMGPPPAVAGVVTEGPLGARGGATRHTCVVCLERYEAGDKLRVLPCQHRFHCRCIDPWLASRRLCPVCKHDASQWPATTLQAGGLQPPPRAVTTDVAGQALGHEAAGGDGSIPLRLPAGLVFFGHRFLFRRLRARLARTSQRHAQQRQGLLAGAGAGAGAAPGPMSAAAAAVAAAAAAADAAEAGLLQQPGAAIAAAAAAAAAAAGGGSGMQHEEQQRWQRRWQWRSGQGGGGLEQPLLSPPDTAAEPLPAYRPDAPAAAAAAAAGAGSRLAAAGRLAPQQGSSGGSRPQLIMPASTPVPIPQLTPAHSLASSAASRESHSASSSRPSGAGTRLRPPE